MPFERRVLAGALLLSLLILPAFGEDVTSLFDQGNSHYQQGDYSGALVLYDRVLATNNENFNAWIARGNTLIRLGRFSEAVDSFNQSIRINPQSVPAWRFKGYALSSLGKYPEALMDYDRAVALDPEDPDSWDMKGLVLSGMGKYHEAIDAFEHATALNPRDVIALTGKGIALTESGRYHEAIPVLTQSTVIDPTYVLSYDYLGQAYQKTGDLKNATAAFSKAIRLDPSNTDLQTKFSEASLKGEGSAYVSSPVSWTPILTVVLILAAVICTAVYLSIRKKRRARLYEDAMADLLRKDADSEPGVPRRRGIHHEVFISYSSKNKPIADAICATLEKNHIRCWIAPRDLLPGTSFPTAIISAIDESRIMVLVFSSFSNNSPHVIRELTRAVNRGVIIIPFRIEDVELSKDMEYLISVPHWLDAMTDPLERHLEKLVQTVTVIITRDPEECHESG